MEPINWFMKVVTQHYFDFNGRARRAEFWWFTLVFGIGYVVLTVIGGMIGLDNVLGGLFALALLLPGVGVGVRRMHDINRSGWFSLVPIMDIVWAAQVGDTGANQYGPDPKAPV